MDLFPNTNDWTLFGFIFLGIFIVLGVAETIRLKMNKPPESTRKFVHVLIGLVVSVCPLLFQEDTQLITLSSVFIVINWFLLKSNKMASMHATERKSYGTVYFPFAVLILSSLWWDKPISFILAIMVLTLADPIAATVGAKGRITFTPWRDLKSRRGSLAMFGTTFLIIMIGTDILARIYGATFLMPFHILVGVSFFTAFSAALA